MLAGFDRVGEIIARSPAQLLIDETTPDGQAFERAVRDIVLRVRQIDPIHIERVIIALRQSWRALPELRLVSDDGVREAMWNRVLTICLETFYDDTPPA